MAVFALALCLAGCGPRPDRPEIDVARIRADTEYLCGVIGARPAGSREERAGCDWLERRLTEMNFSRADGTLVRTPFEGLNGLTSENIMAVCNPQSTGPIICVTAHYDSVPGCPGARDNGASAAILLELARIFGPRQQSLDAEIRLLFPGSEENGYHGSAFYADCLSPEERDRHLAVFNMDISAASRGGDAVLVCNTLGGNTESGYREGDPLAPADNLVSRTISQVHRELYGGEDVPVLHHGESDHLIFHKAGIDAANVCWRETDGPLPVLPEEYHKPEDTPDGIDYATAEETAVCVLAAIRQLAGT